MPTKPFVVRTDYAQSRDVPYSSHTTMSAAIKMIHNCVVNHDLVSSAPDRPWKFWVTYKDGRVLAGPFDHNHLPPRS
jgi:hypothetical protein